MADRLRRSGVAAHFGTFSASGSAAKAMQAGLPTPIKHADPDDFDG